MIESKIELLKDLCTGERQITVFLLVLICNLRFLISAKTTFFSWGVLCITGKYSSFFLVTVPNVLKLW